MNENSWGNATEALPYARAKVLSEREAWDVQVAHEREGGRTRLATVLPGWLLGPLLLPTRCPSADMVQSMLEGTYGSVPDAYLGFTDVRDAARAHVAAMLNQNTNGRRVLHCTSHRSLQDMSGVLFQEFAVDGYLVPQSRRWDCSVRLLACLCRNAQSRVLAPHLSQKVFTYDMQLVNDLCRDMPGWHSFESSVSDMAHSLLQSGQVRDLTPGRTFSNAGLQPCTVSTVGLVIAVAPSNAYSSSDSSAAGVGRDAHMHAHGQAPDLAHATSGEAKSTDGYLDGARSHSEGSSNGNFAASGGHHAAHASFSRATPAARTGGDETLPQAAASAGPESESSSDDEQKPGGVDVPPERWRRLRGGVRAAHRLQSNTREAASAFTATGEGQIGEGKYEDDDASTSAERQSHGGGGHSHDARSFISQESK